MSACKGNEERYEENARMNWREERKYKGQEYKEGG
jgi:hypothetical protein